MQGGDIIQVDAAASSGNADGAAPHILVILIRQGLDYARVRARSTLQPSAPFVCVRVRAALCAEQGRSGEGGRCVSRGERALSSTLCGGLISSTRPRTRLHPPTTALPAATAVSTLCPSPPRLVPQPPQPSQPPPPTPPPPPPPSPSRPPSPPPSPPSASTPPPPPPSASAAAPSPDVLHS